METENIKTAADLKLLGEGSTIYLADYHIHPNYSIDADDYSIENYCEKALEIGLKEICFTTHFECDPQRAHLDWLVRCRGTLAPMTGNWLDSYFEEIVRAQDKYAPMGLKVKNGLEVGYDLGLEDAIARVLRYPFDFVIGSVHCVDHVAISSARESCNYFPGKQLTDVVRKYFTTLLEGVKTGLFDVVGHMDLYRRHGLKFFGTDVENAHEGLVEPVLEEMAKRNIGMEINTSSLKHGQNEFYPSKKILLLAKEFGISVYTTGSDSHRISELGRGIKEAVLLLDDMGLKVSTFERRCSSIIE